MSASVSLSSLSEFAAFEIDHRITLNYAKSPAQIFTDFIAHCVETSQSLDIICRHWAPVLIPIPNPKEKESTDVDSNSSMPSWVSLITGSAFGSPEAALQGRSNGDSLVGSSSSHYKKNYNASAGLRAFAEFTRSHVSSPGDSSEDYGGEERVSTHGQEPSTSTLPKSMKQTKYNNTLIVRGIRLDKIGKLSPRAAEGMIFHECLNMAGWSYGAPLKEVEDSLWQTLVADRGPDGIRAPCWYRRASLSCLARVTQSGDLNTDAVMANAETPSTMVAFLKRVQEVVWNRKFLRSSGGPLEEEDKKLLGLAPRTAEEGDHICILFGCSVPVILREFCTQSGVYFKLVGEAYIHGMMDGEALSGNVPEYPYEDNDTVETFEIR